MAALTRRPSSAHERDLVQAVFHVCVEGSDPIGPVSAEQIARGVIAGRVPRDAFVAREGAESWTDLLDVPEVVRAMKCV